MRRSATGDPLGKFPAARNFRAAPACPMATLAKERLAVTAGTETSNRTEMLPDRRRAVLIVNTRARSGASAYEQARQLLARRGFTLDASFPVQDPARIPKLVTDALAEGHSFVMIGGGDGTIGAAVNVLAGKDATCGLLPLGTANSFARSLDLPLDLDAAVEVLATGRTKEVDLGKINDRYFTTAVAIGALERDPAAEAGQDQIPARPFRVSDYRGPGAARLQAVHLYADARRRRAPRFPRRARGANCKCAV